MNEFFSSAAAFMQFVQMLVAATVVSGILGYPVLLLIERILGGESGQKAEIEALFSKLNWIAPALLAAGLLIIYAGIREAKQAEKVEGQTARDVSWADAVVMGILQGFAIPFRGFSRSGSTISGGLLAGGSRARIESFSFAMAVALTPLAIGREGLRVLKFAKLTGVPVDWSGALKPGVIGMVCAFAAGLLALRWLSSWLEKGRWHYFGIYCLVAAAGIGYLYHLGY